MRVAATKEQIAKVRAAYESLPLRFLEDEDLAAFSHIIDELSLLEALKMLRAGYHEFACAAAIKDISELRSQNNFMVSDDTELKTVELITETVGNHVHVRSFGSEEVLFVCEIHYLYDEFELSHYDAILRYSLKHQDIDLSAYVYGKLSLHYRDSIEHAVEIKCFVSKRILWTIDYLR